MNYIDYAKGCLDGSIVCCQYVKLACKRFFDFKDNRTDIEFRPDKVERVIRFISMLHHFTGRYNNQSFIPAPWQEFLIANLFGFFYTGTNKRVTKNVYIEVSRKNGKTALAAAIGLYCMIADNEPAAEIELVANSSKQAGICFASCKGFSESIDTGKIKYFKKYRDSLKFENSNSLLQVLSADAGVADGYNSYCYIIDEYHAARNSEMYDVLKSSQGMRENPLAIVITTAGFNLEGPCYTMRNTNIEILKGIKKDDSVFSAIYTLDDGDDWRDESCWLKCNPNLDVTVKKSYLREQVTQADNNPSMEVGIVTKNFNKWLQRSDIWIPDKYIIQGMKPLQIEDMKTDYCYAAIDLASVSDLTAISVMTYRQETDRCYFKTYYYLPEDTLYDAGNVNAYQYRQWKNDGYLNTTPDNVTDYDYILENLLEINSVIPIYKCSYDSWNSSQFVISAVEKGLPMVPYSQSLGSFNRPTKEFERKLLSGRIIIDENPITRWCFLNARLKFDHFDNCKPVKDQKSQKIDGVITILMSLGGKLNEEGYDTTITS